MTEQSAADGSAHKKRMVLERRRRLFRTRLPEHFCSRCTSVTLYEETSCPECGAPRPPGGWPALRDHGDAWLGKVLDGRYLVASRLGQGSSASVYRADSLSISRQFAVKIINTGTGQAAEQVITRLNREIEALGRLRNPHIVSFYEVLELNGLFVAAVMDLIDGVTLETFVTARGELSVPRACTILRQIANGLYEAHQAGMIHRDLKPENLMVERLPAGDDFVHILDFGIVRLEDEAQGVSMTHGFIGTPLYASPEQAVAGVVDHRSDIYSLGAILFFMLTGRPPFVSNNVYEVLKMHVRTPAPRLAHARPDLQFPEELEELVARMLAKAQNNRPRDLSQVIDELDSFAATSYSDVQQSESGQASSESSAATELGRPASTSASSSFERDMHESSSTVQGFATRKPKTTPAFFRDHTPGRVDRAEILEPIPGRITYAAPTTKLEASPEPEPEHPVRGMRPPAATPMRGVAAADTPIAGLPAITAAAGLIMTEGRVSENIQSACAPGPLYTILAQGTRRLHVHRAGSATPIELAVATAPEVSALAIAETHVVCGHVDGSITRIGIDPSSRTERLFQDVRQVPISAVATDLQQRVVVAGSRSGRVYLRSLLRPNLEWMRMRSGASVQCVAVSAGVENLAVARDGETIEIYQLATLRAPVLSFGSTGRVSAMAISNDNYLLAAVVDADRVMLFHMLTGKPILNARTGARRVLGLFFAADNTPMALCLESGSLATHELQKVAAMV